MEHKMYQKAVITKTAGNTAVYPYHCHNSWEILCYTKNTGHLGLDCGLTIPFSVGTILLVPPNLLHGSRADSAFENICVEDPAFPSHKITADIRKTSMSGVLQTNDNITGDITALFQMSYRQWISGTDSDNCIRHLLDAAYAMIFQPMGIIGDTSMTTITEQMRNHMIEHFRDPDYSVSDAITYSGVGANKARQLFRSLFSITPMEFLRSLRLKNAESLLLFSDETMTISEIAYGSGFRDPLYFSKVFHEAYGTTPTEYRMTFRNREYERIKYDE